MKKIKFIYKYTCIAKDIILDIFDRVFYKLFLYASNLILPIAPLFYIKTYTYNMQEKLNPIDFNNYIIEYGFIIETTEAFAISIAFLSYFMIYCWYLFDDDGTIYTNNIYYHFYDFLIIIKKSIYKFFNYLKLRLNIFHNNIITEIKKNE